MGQESGMGQGPGMVQEPGVGGDSSIGAWIWQGTGFRESARYCKQTGKVQYKLGRCSSLGGCKCLGMGGYLDRGRGWTLEEK